MGRLYKSLTVIVSGFGGLKKLKSFLPSVVDAYQNYGGNKEFIVTGFDPKNNVGKFLRENYPFIKFIKSPGENNLSADLNLTAKSTKNEILFFVTRPVWLDENYFLDFSGYFSSDEVFGLTGCWVDIKSGCQVYGFRKGVFRYGLMRFYDVLNENLKPSPEPLKSFGMQKECFFVCGEKFEKIGGFDEIYLQSFSADDLAYRAINRGFSILYSPALKSRHKTLDLSLTEEIFYARDNIIFVWKNLTDAKYIKQHILFLCLRILTLNLFYWFGFLKAFRLLKRIEKSRKTQAEKSVFSDSQIFEFFKNYFSAVVKR